MNQIQTMVTVLFIFSLNNNIIICFKFIVKITNQTDNNDTKDIETMVSLKYLTNVWRTLEIPLINY